MNKHKHKYDQQFTNDDCDIIVHIELCAITEASDISIKELERILWQAKETLNQQVAKQKTWDQPEENQVAQPEQESSIPNKDQRLPEKEQSQKIVKTNKKQYIISYPQGQSIDADTNEILDNCDIARNIQAALNCGDSISIPNYWKVQVIDL